MFAGMIGKSAVLLSGLAAVSLCFAEPAFTMRIDDNHSPADWMRVADIFERRGVKVSFAVVSAGLSESQGKCLKQLADRGHEFGYIGADSHVNAKQGDNRWSTGFDKMVFFDQGPDYTPEGLVDDIQKALAAGRYHVLLSHMWGRKLKGGKDEWFEKTDRFAQLLADRKVPTMTMGQSLEARFGKSEKQVSSMGKN